MCEHHAKRNRHAGKCALKLACPPSLMHTCIHACTYACKQASMYAHKHARTRTHVHTHTRTLTHPRTHTPTHAQGCSRLDELNLAQCSQVRMHAHMCMCARMCACVRIRACAPVCGVRVCKHVCMHACARVRACSCVPVRARARSFPKPPGDRALAAVGLDWKDGRSTSMA